MESEPQHIRNLRLDQEAADLVAAAVVRVRLDHLDECVDGCRTEIRDLRGQVMSLALAIIGGELMLGVLVLAVGLSVS